MAPLAPGGRLDVDGSSLELMERIAAYIAQNHSSPLRVSDVARRFHVSVRTLQNLFHASCGESPLRALRRYRLVCLHTQLTARPWQSLRQAYDGCGLSGSRADRELFREMYGISIREHQQACCDKRALAPVPPIAHTTLLTYLDSALSA